MSPDAVTIHDLKGDANPYAYVHGSPLMGVDPDGNFAQMAIGAIVGAVVSTVTQLAVNGTVDWKEVAISAAVGAITGGVGSVLGSGVMAGAASGMVGNAANSILHGESISAKGLATGALSGGVSGGVSAMGGTNPTAATLRTRVFWNFLKDSYACVRWSDGSSLELPSGYGMASSNPDAVPTEVSVSREDNDQASPVTTDVSGAVGRCPRKCDWALSRRGVMEVSPAEALAAYRFFPTRGRVRFTSQTDCPDVSESLESIRPSVKYWPGSGHVMMTYVPTESDP